MTRDRSASFNMAESFYRRASNRLEEARENLTQKYNYPESISASQESMEFSTKAIFLYLEEKYPKTHEFSDEQFMKILGKIPKNYQHYNFPRLLLLTRFWSRFYETAKYGNEKLGVGPEKLFKESEAKLALEHANDCYSAAYGIRNWAYKRRP